MTLAQKRAGSRLFWRIYLHGIGLLVLTTAAVVAIGHITRPREMHVRHRRTMMAIAARVDEAMLATAAGDIRARLKAAIEDTPIDASVYDHTGALLASNIEPPLSPVPPHELMDRRGLEGPHPPFEMGALKLARSGAVLVWRPAWGNDDDRLRRVLTTVLIMLVILTVVSLPLARRIAMPIDRLVAAAQALGRGELRSRTGIERRDDIGDLARTFDEMAERLETLLRSEKELLANISHELRTPLARMRVALELAAEGDADAARRYMAEVGVDIGELERLIDDVLTTARFDLADGRDASVPPLRLERLPSSVIASEAAERFGSSYPSRKLTVDVIADGPEIVADRVLLRRAVDNLLENAAKYSGSEAPIELAMSTSGDSVSYTVRDRGAGMAESDLNQLFTPFFRGDRSRSRATGGFGLGLALARRIVEAHGGTLTAASSLGEGSTFTVRVPLTKAAPARV